jgi:hypothetical protein
MQFETFLLHRTGAPKTSYLSDCIRNGEAEETENLKYSLVFYSEEDAYYYLSLHKISGFVAEKYSYEVGEIDETQLKLSVSSTTKQLLYSDFEKMSARTFKDFLFTIIENFQTISMTAIGSRAHELLQQLKENDIDFSKKNCVLITQKGKPAKEENNDNLSPLPQLWISPLENSLLSQILPLIKQPNPVSISLSLSSNDLNKLKNILYSSNSYFYDFSLSRYLKAVLEDYSQLKAYERERVYYQKSLITPIQDIINQKKSFKMDIHSENKFLFVYPICILSNPKNDAYNYIIGFASENNDFQEAGVSQRGYRLSRLENNVSHSNNEIESFEPIRQPTEEMIASLKERIAESGLEYLEDESKITNVYLTKEGVKMYNHILENRPNTYRTTTDVSLDGEYSFKGTNQQFFNYFRLFGQDALISPESNPYLYNELAKFYSEASAAYPITKEKKNTKQ